MAEENIVLEELPAEPVKEELWSHSNTLREELEFLDALVIKPDIAITLIVPPSENLENIRQKLKNQVESAKNISLPQLKSSAKEALNALIDHLSNIETMPAQGLCLIFGKGKNPRTNKTVILRQSLVLPHPPSQLIYSCASKIKLDYVWQMLFSRGDMGVGYVVIDGNEYVIAIVAGNGVEMLVNETVTLPRKHGRGGQSAARFDRQRQECRHVYVKKVAENVGIVFLSANKPIIQALVVAGTGYLKHELIKTISPVVQKLVVKVLTVSYGGKPGLREAMDSTQELLVNLSIDKTKRHLNDLFNKLADDDHLVSVGEEDVFAALEDGACRTVLVWEESPLVGRLLDLCPNGLADLVLVKEQFGNHSKMLVKGLGGVAAINRYHYTHP